MLYKNYRAILYLSAKIIFMDKLLNLSRSISGWLKNNKKIHMKAIILKKMPERN